ncbi:hypothetical protein K503DRAFT_774467 [Rhizopogon vinicolor AM-OR11-026]|uniref:Secreted protein n=1 Tax=Rhizopogon vinicolor AM-OR11-026 TaxID=1314800 RepID=A0A1B7MPH4_9AGAM|nr:hypothetical protein K503DRAFT_774467 [Rhizopogon vinicolor AM-OR11-026]
MSGSLPSHLVILHTALLILPITPTPFQHGACGMSSSPLDRVRQQSLFLCNHPSNVASLRGTRDRSL